MTPVSGEGGSKEVVILSIPSLSLLQIEPLASTKLAEFFEKNEKVFVQLVAVMYAASITEELRAASPQTLFELLCANMKMVLTAASPQWECMKMERPARGEGPRVNRIALEFLLNHIKREGVATWQDYYGSRRKDLSKVNFLVDTFIHYIIWRAFKDGAATIYIRNESKLVAARGVIRKINLGEEYLKAV